MKLNIKYGSLAAVGAALSISPAILGQQPIGVLVNGAPVNFEGQGPAMVNDRVLVPLRGVLERMGARVDWEPSTQTVRARRGQSRVELTIGQNTAAVNGQPVNLDVPAQIMNGSTMVPLRFLGEALGEDVRWDGPNNTVVISGQGYNIPPPIVRPVAPPPGYGPPPVVLEQNTVIAASLNIDLSPDECRPGRRVSALVSHYPGLPDGCRIEGVIQDVAPGAGGPGALELAFDTIVDPRGRRIPIHGQAVQLNDPDLQRRPDGRVVDRGGDKRFLIAGGQNGAKLVRVQSRAPAHDPRTVQEVKRASGGAHQAVHLSKGLQIGIRITSPVTVRH